MVTVREGFDSSLAEQALGRIRAEPHAHTQAAWRCSTGMCFAGHVADVSGMRWAFRADAPGVVSGLLVDEGGALLRDYLADIAAGGPLTDEGVGVSRLPEWLEPGVDCDARVTHVSDWVRARLGLTGGEANALFAPDNQLDDLERGVKVLVAGRRIVNLMGHLVELPEDR